jgi:tetratricopeptide (TPR) repeat protein
LSGECDPAIGNVEESLRFQKDIPSKDLNPSLHCETLILYGNILAAQNSLSEAAFYYDSALSSNPNKEPLEPTNLKAWYNKGMYVLHCEGNLMDRLID